MRTLTCMIVDDEPLAVRMIEDFVSRTPGLETLASFNDPVEALARLKETPADVIFLDIQMPDLDGLSLSRMIPPETRVIFTTAFREYAFDSYEVNALDYLLKPIRYPKFLKAVEKAREYFAAKSTVSGAAHSQAPEAKRDSVFVRVDGQLRKIQVERILYVEGMKDYVRIFLEDEPRPVITHATMKAMEEMLPPDKFMRVQRSYIVALDKIRSIDRGGCIRIGKEVIRVTDSYKEAFGNYLKGNVLE